MSQTSSIRTGSGSVRSLGSGSRVLSLGLERHADGPVQLALLLVLALLVATLPANRGSSGSDRSVSVIVRELPGAGSVPEQAVEAFGGDVERYIPIIGGFVAEVPAAAVPELRRLGGIQSVTLNSRVRLLGNIDGVDPNKDPGSWLKVAKKTKLLEMWQHGFTGQGIDVALIDSGVAPFEGLTVQVINGPDLSFGTDGTQDYLVDPLADAVEVAWLRGIVVVVAAGNSGFGTPQLNNPAYDPYVIAVGADDTRGTDDPKDDVIPAWQSRGNPIRHPDVVAPGKSLISLRDPGSFVDEANPNARVGYTRFFRGSGSSQATAIVSGAVATLLEQHPDLTPDQVKALLMTTAVPLPNADPVAQGDGLINLHRAREAKISTIGAAVQTWPRSVGTGSLQSARGSVLTEDEGVVLRG